MFSRMETSAGTAVANNDHDGLGLSFQVASTLEQVTEAWELVYSSYLRIGLISPNAHHLHTHSHAISCDTAVICGYIDRVLVSTLSSYIDGPDGLPLDAVYHEELQELRADGRTLLELGLFADRREHLFRSIEALLELMRYNCYFGVTHECTDAVIGVHPHHVDFYTRLLGFDVVGEQKTYDMVNDHPVVLLRLDWPAKTSAARLPRGLKHMLANPLDRQVYDQRFALNVATIVDSRIDRFLQDTGPTISVIR